jgi:hypothetical protein
MHPTSDQPAIRETLARMDTGWAEFIGRVRAMRRERIEHRRDFGQWTRKQMLAHISAWHELTIERLAALAETGQPSGPEEHEDIINARAARAADGRTTGEVLLELEDSYRRLHRQVARMTDEHLATHDDWAAAVIAGNTYDHYAEHLADLEVTASER